MRELQEPILSQLREVQQEKAQLEKVCSPIHNNCQNKACSMGTCMYIHVCSLLL